MRFIKDDARMFVRGTNDFKEIKRDEEDYEKGARFTITLLANESGDKFVVALCGEWAVAQEEEGLYYFDDQKEAEQFYQKNLLQLGARLHQIASGGDWDIKLWLPNGAI